MIKKIISVFVFLVALSVLISLGSWQIKRLTWKENIIAKLETEYQKDPLENFYTLENLTLESDLPLLYGSAKGQFIYDKEILAGPKPHDGSIGFLVITPMKLDSGGYILVNRGWIDQSKTDSLKQTHIQGQITASGIFRKPDWNSFTPDNSPENNIWTKLDIKQISDVKNITPVAPLLLYAESASKKSDVLIMQQERWHPRNKHKQYAIFWFTMAFALIGVFGFYIFQQKRKRI